jgi:hypothetical protein
MPLRDRAAHGRRLLDRYLFPEPAAPPAGPRWERAGVATAFVVLAVVIQLARIGFPASLNALWAEDGSVFLQDALTQGFGEAVGREYSGYLVLVPRLIGELATVVPLEGAAAAVSILAALLVALSGLAVWHAASAHIPDPFLRGTLVLALVLTPVGGLESIDSAAYVSWYMLFAVFWILLWRPRSLYGAALGALLVAATVLSNPGAWFLLPIALLRLLAVRDGRDATLLGAYFGASAIQLAAMLGSSYESTEPLWTRDVWGTLLQRVVDGAALGVRLGGGIWDELGGPYLIAVTVVVVLAFAIGLARSDGRARAFALVALPTAIGMFVLSVYQRAVATLMLWPEGTHSANAGRYAIVPTLLVISAAMVLAESWRRQHPASQRAAWPAVAIVGLVLVSVAVALPAGYSAARGDTAWDQALDQAAADCTKDPDGYATFPTSPPFSMTLPCSLIPE